MADYAIEFDGVWKKFKKGEDFDSLRDLVPALARRVLSRDHSGDLAKREFWALKDFSFAIRKGEAVAIMGHNGSGKSTSLKLMSGILRPNKGRVAMQGRLGALIEIGAGFHPDLTGRENIYLYGTILGLSRGEIDANFASIVEFAEIEEFIDTPVKRFSSGMYARLGFSVAAHVRPDILLVDEVLAVGDIAFQRKCLDRINALKEDGTTIVFISHNLQAVLDLCPRVIWLDHGVQVMDGPADEVVAAYLKRTHAQPGARNGGAPDSDVVIRKVSFVDETGREQDSFAPGEALTLRIALEAVKPVSRPVIGLAFYASDGTCIYGHNSKIDRWEAGDVHGPVEFEIAYDGVHLHPGRYLVSLAVHDVLGRRHYVHADRAYGFHIKGAVASGVGVLSWPHTWRRLGPQR
jgi:lipopolysaccharide transport system ATP-binding protein